MRADAPAGMRARARDAVLRWSTRLGLDAGARALGARRAAGDRVRVMVLHGTPARDADAFAAQVRWVRDRFALLDPREYLEVLAGRSPPPRRPAIVFTFDDGLASNAHVAAPILEAAGTRGIFFVCPGFLGRAGEDARRFFGGRVRTEDDLRAAPADDFTPMTADDVRALHRRGHVVGNHTHSHQDLGRASSDAEIGGARDELAAMLGAGVDCFAWTFAWNAITADAWARAIETHRFCFTACPGAGALAPTCVWRTNVEATLRPHELAFFYSGLADPIWWSRRRRLAALHADARARARR